MPADRTAGEGDRRPPQDAPAKPAGKRRLSDEGLSRKATLNAAAAMLDYAARLVVGFVLNPLLVSRLGSAEYGTYQVLGRLIGYASPAGGRPSQALKWTIAHHQRSADVAAKRRQVGSAFTVWLLFLPPLVLISLTLAWFAPVWLGAPESLYTTIRVAAAVLALDLVVTNLVTIPQSVLQGENLAYRRMGATTLIVVVGGLITAAVLLAGGGLVGVALSVLATTLLTGLTFFWVVRRNVAWFGMERPPLREVLPFMRLSGWFLLWNLVIQLMRGSDVVVLGIAASTEVVTVYVLARYVPEAIFAVVAIAVSAVMPGLGGLVGAKENKAATGVRGESMCVTWLVTTACGVLFLVFAESFLTLWVGAEYYPGQVATLLIVAMMMQFALIRNDASIIDLTLDLRSKVVLGLVSSGIAIALGVFLLERVDDPIIGMTVGFMAGRAILSVSYPWMVARSLGQSPWPQFVSAVRPAVVAILAGAAATLAAPSITIDSWLTLLLAGAVAAPVTVAVVGIVGLTRAQRGRLMSRARRVAAAR